MSVASAGPNANHFYLDPDRQPCHHLITQFFMGRMLFLPPSEHCQSTEGRSRHCLYMMTGIISNTDSEVCVGSNILYYSNMCLCCVNHRHRYVAASREVCRVKVLWRGSPAHKLHWVKRTQRISQKQNGLSRKRLWNKEVWVAFPLSFLCPPCRRDGYVFWHSTFLSYLLV